MHLKPADHLNVERGSLVIWLRQCRQQGLCLSHGSRRRKSGLDSCRHLQFVQDTLNAPAEYLTLLQSSSRRSFDKDRRHTNRHISEDATPVVDTFTNTL